MTIEEMVAGGAVLVDEPHPDGGVGLRVTALDGGSLGFQVQVPGTGEVFFVVGPVGATRLTGALSIWQAGQAMAPAPEVTDE